MAVLSVPLATHLSYRPIYLRQNEVVGFTKFINLVDKSSMCFGKIHKRPTQNP